jgi:hypothetical protein
MTTVSRMRKSTAIMHLNRKIQAVEDDRAFWVGELDKAQRENLSGASAQAYGNRVDVATGSLYGLRFALSLLTDEDD